MKPIVFNVPVIIPKKKLDKVYESLTKFSGDGPWTKKCHAWFDNFLSTQVLLSTSCTHSLEMMALLIGIQPGDEVIMPSFTFVSTASAFVLRGAKIIFVDIRSDTMNIDEKLIEDAITSRTKAIVVVHYAGVACEMVTIKSIAEKYRLFLLEDAAQGMMSTYNDLPLGTFGDLGTYSFHETKNYHCGEGGLLIINNKSFHKTAEMIREKGTDRSAFLRNEVDKYTWQVLGSSYLPSEFNAVYLYHQLEIVNTINENRLSIWNRYFQGLKSLENVGYIELPQVPVGCKHNAHLFYIKTRNLEVRNSFIQFMKNNLVQVVSHYVPLHSSPAGKMYGMFNGLDNYTTKESERLVRLPLYYGLSEEDVTRVLSLCYEFFDKKLSSLNEIS